MIDNGYAAAGALTGWYNGDFNYDGVIDGSDYTLIDNAFNNQGSQLTTPTALVATDTAQVAPSAVPEPASLGPAGRRSGRIRRPTSSAGLMANRLMATRLMAGWALMPD